jgi:hypothetical protein
MVYEFLLNTVNLDKSQKHIKSFLIFLKFFINNLYDINF